MTHACYALKISLYFSYYELAVIYSSAHISIIFFKHFISSTLGHMMMLNKAEKETLTTVHYPAEKGCCH